MGVGGDEEGTVVVSEWGGRGGCGGEGLKSGWIEFRIVGGGGRRECVRGGVKNLVGGGGGGGAGKGD